MTLKFENPGYVYILSNESLKDLKIGYTQNSPYDRSFDLFTTGVPTPFFVEKYWFVEDAMLCEELIHERLTRFRTNESREFFRVDLDKAVMAALQAMDDLRERLWAKNELKNNYKPKPAQNEMPDSARTTPAQKHADEIIAAGMKPLVQQYSYNNPKFKAMMKVLKENKYPLTVEDIAKKISISPKGVESLIKMMQSQQGAMLYSKEENKVKKYAMSLSFNVHQLKMLSEKYPDLQLMELESIFEKPAQSNKTGYQNSGEKSKWTPKADAKAPVAKPTESQPAQAPVQQKAASPVAQPAAKPAAPAPQQRSPSDKVPSPAEFIQKKINQESQQTPKPAPQKPAAPAPVAAPMSEKDLLISRCRASYQEVIDSGQLKTSQAIVRKPIKP